MTNEAAVTVNGIEYTATVEGDSVTIYADGVWSCDGRWDGASIEDADAPLGDDVYDALEAALCA